jgi:2-polyprenyl-6-methoxyphenol hydroxylase-like FAD-dependent oxidoreductase
VIGIRQRDDLLAANLQASFAESPEAAVMAIEEVSTHCCIVGGGPCGLMLGFLLARAGIDVVVLEKHGDFLRDFRGDTIHPSTMEVMFELGLLDEFLKLPHQKEDIIVERFGSRKYALADFRHLPTRAKFLALMPQWNFLNFLAEEGRKYPSFRLRMRTQAAELIEKEGRVTGVRATSPDGEIEIRADLTVGCDGRHSTVRACSGLTVEDLGAPIDALWFLLPKHASDPIKTTSSLEAGRSIVLMDRGEYWQCALMILKGSIEETRNAGLPALRAEIAQLVPAFADRVEALADWAQIKLLSVTVNRLERWYRPGLLCIGDAAHAMSPILGVGLGLAVQDAVAAANILWRPLATRALREADLKCVQKRREFPTRLTQGIQMFLHRAIGRALHQTDGALEAPTSVRLLAALPLLRRLPARLVGMGVRPEHVHTPQIREVAGRGCRVRGAA